MAHILIIEDNEKLAHNVQEALLDQGFASVICGTGAKALSAIAIQIFDVILLDLGLPDVDGIDLVELVRRQAPQAGIIIVTARDKVEDRIAGLDKGGDDYLVKPFALTELIARVRAILRRTQQPSNASLKEVAGLTMDMRKRHIIIEGETVDLPPREFDLLAFLIEHRGSPVSREMLTQEVWQVTSRATSLNNVIDVHISRLRERLQPYKKETLIKTIRGVGFTFDG